jgi:hypothetical protein
MTNGKRLRPTVSAIHAKVFGAQPEALLPIRHRRRFRVLEFEERLARSPDGKPAFRHSAVFGLQRNQYTLFGATRKRRGLEVVPEAFCET